MGIWQLLAGLGLFLYGMNLMEHVLKKISGRSFKIFLKNQTQNLFKAVAGGTIITAIIQSSSIVSLLVLAFVGAGIIKFQHALGVILGSNLGTTFSSWIVATVGFKIDIESYSLPVIAITAIAMFFFHRHKKFYNQLRVFFSIGILFMGLGLMKNGADTFVTIVDLRYFNEYHSIVFVLVGFIVTSIIQSSSATVAITLTALYANAISFPSAAAVVIGAELGTTIKLVIAAFNGGVDKKRVAWGNFSFNATTILLAYTFLTPLLTFIQTFLGINDPLIGLVAFQSLINLLTIIVFVPLIKPFSRWLEKKINEPAPLESSFISHDFPAVPAMVLEVLFNETQNLIRKTTTFHRTLFKLEPEDSEGLLRYVRPDYASDDLYERLKKTEGEILHYCTRLQPEDLEREHHELLNQYLAAVRHCIHAAKSMKDIQHDLKNLSESGNDALHAAYLTLQKEWKEFDAGYQRLLEITNAELLNEELTGDMKNAFHIQQQNNLAIVNQLKHRTFNEVETSTLMNVQREVLSGKKSLLRALAHLKLSHTQADAFEFLPEY